jgi:hypothetical protein
LALIDWNQSYDELFKDISEKFQIIEDCDSSITLYLTFPSYPENNLLLNFFKSFQNPSSTFTSSMNLNNDKDFYYRNNVDPSFLPFVDALPLPVFQQLLRQYSNVRLVLCGHGLGGTVAQLSTLHLLSTEFSTHHTKLRSISFGSLFFAKEDTLKLIKEHHFEHHFINIYHEMDVLPSLFNVAGFLSKVSLSIVEQKTLLWLWNKFVSVKSFLLNTENPIEKHHFYIKYMLTSLCESLMIHYLNLSSKVCEPSIIEQTLNVLGEALKYATKLLKEDHRSKLIYQPVGIFNLITYRNFDETWHLINVVNTSALRDRLNVNLEQLTKSEQIYRSHSVSNYLMGLQQCNKQQMTSTQTKTLLSLITSFVNHESLKDNTNDMLNSNENLDSSIVIPLPFRFSNYSYTEFRSVASYMNMIAQLPILPFDNSTILNSQFSYLKRKFLSAIKHRTDIFKINLYKKSTNKNLKSSNIISMYDICLSIYETYGMDARMELMKLQLDQRMLIPILVSTNAKLSYSVSSLPNSFQFRSYIKTLSFVETAVLQPQENILAKDSQLLRVGLISTIQKQVGGLPDFIKHIFQVTTIRQFTQGMGTDIKAKTILEIGYGFLPDINSPFSYRPVILVHIIGDYRPLISFIIQYVDALLVEHNEDDNNFAQFEYNRFFQSLRIQRIMKWKNTINTVFNEIISSEVPYMIDEFEGSVTAVTSTFQTYLLELVSDSISYLCQTRDRPRLIDLINDKELLIDDDIPIIDTKELFENLKKSKLKREQFELQRSYKKEAESQLEKDNPKFQLSYDYIKQLENRIQKERQKRSQIYKEIEEIEILKFYISLISESNDEKRYIQNRQFEFVLSQYNEELTSIIRNKKDKMFIEMKEAEKAIITAKKNDANISLLKEKQEKTIKNYYQAKQDFIDTSLIIDHFWREISHLFVANQTKYEQLPHFAAQHLLDGFPLELLDGDSMFLNEEWIKEVFYSLNSKLDKELGRSARILVLSICGPQSSGKSFLLKTMYGLRIRSSVGACTQGVNILLVKVQSQHYDYILLLDTEGIRAPEFSAMKDAEIRDNTLASFAILPADGTILLNKGEINQALEEVLPIVLYLYATSSLSKNLGGQIQSKLFFVYNQIDTSQPQKGMELLQDLITRLQNITHSVIEAVSSEKIPFYGFEQYRLDLNDLSNSDFRILTNNKNNPPINHPVYLFGEQSLYLREWIDKRITNTSDTRQWTPRSIIDIIDYFIGVSKTVRQAPHITSVNKLLEIFENNKLNAQIENIKHNLSSFYNHSQTQVEKETISTYKNSAQTYSNKSISDKELEDIIDKAHETIQQKMHNVILESQDKIFNIIKGTKSEVDHQENWKHFLQDKPRRSKKMLRIKIVHELITFDFYRKTREKIGKDIINKFDQINCINFSTAEQETIFNNIFSECTKEPQEQYRVESIDVSSEIKTVYNNSVIIKDFHIFNEDQICYDNGSSKQLSKEDNLLKYIQDNQFNDIIDEIKLFINNLITGESRYQSFIVTNVLQRIQQIINERSIVSIDTIKHVHRETYCFLEYKLIKLQNEWDSLYNRTKDLEENRQKFWEFFQHVVETVPYGDLLRVRDNKISNSCRNEVRVSFQVLYLFFLFLALHDETVIEYLSILFFKHLYSYISRK